METSLRQHSVDCHCALFPAKSEPAEPGTHVPLRGPSIVLSPAAGILQWVWGQTPRHKVWGGRGARSPSADHSLYVPWERIYCIPEAFPKISRNPIQKKSENSTVFQGEYTVEAHTKEKCALGWVWDSHWFSDMWKKCHLNRLHCRRYYN